VILLSRIARQFKAQALTTALILGTLTAGIAIPVKDAQAQQSVADFYKGKQMRFIIRSAPGGGYDLASRLIAAHITRHIPGHPSIVPQNMPGGGGITSVNYVAEVAPKDGTVVTLIGQSLPMDQSLGYTPSLKADLRSFNWIGNTGSSNMLNYIWHTSPTKTMADAKKRQTLIGGTGAGSATTWFPQVLNKVIGTQFKIIDGYKSGSDVRLAMERGEVEGYGPTAWSSLISASPEIVHKHLINIIVQIGLEKENDLPDVPLLQDLAEDADGRAILEFISKGFAVGMPVGVGPGVPAERVAALRKAFDETMTDPEFVAAMNKHGIDLKPMTGVQLAQLIDELLGAPQAIKDKVRAVMPARS
jgi:tripartite-type tricarboxylate transporter receptor subunit TctC